MKVYARDQNRSGAYPGGGIGGKWDTGNGKSRYKDFHVTLTIIVLPCQIQIQIQIIGSYYICIYG